MNKQVPTRRNQPGKTDGHRANRSGQGAAHDPAEANKNIRKAQGDDSAIGRSGNRPRFDRDR